MENEQFWAGTFGDEYTDRNISENLIKSNIKLFQKVLVNTTGVKNAVEFGCNAGNNMLALDKNGVKSIGFDVNQKAVDMAKRRGLNAHVGGFGVKTKGELSLTKGVLIHQHETDLPYAYRCLYESSTKYILVCEYYNPQPVEVEYRGYAGKLFKRDFAGEMMDMFPLALVDYGFVYHRDTEYPMDDVTWFLMEKALSTAEYR